MAKGMRGDVQEKTPAEAECMTQDVRTEVSGMGASKISFRHDTLNACSGSGWGGGVWAFTKRPSRSPERADILSDAIGACDVRCLLR